MKQNVTAGEYLGFISVSLSFKVYKTNQKKHWPKIRAFVCLFFVFLKSHYAYVFFFLSTVGLEEVKC